MRRDDLDEEDSLFLSAMKRTEKKRARYYALENRKKLYIVLGSIGGGLLLIAIIIILAVTLNRSSSPQVCPSGYSKSNVDLAFFVVGSWGRQGSSSQLTTSNLMTQLAGCFQPDFVISTGDNFFPSGLKSATDPSFTQSFTNVYSESNLQVPWYSVLGEIDYGSTLTSSYINSGVCTAPSIAQCRNASCCYSPLWEAANNITSTNVHSLDSRWNCQYGPTQKRSWTFGDYSIDIMFTDTTPLIASYNFSSWAKIAGGLSSQSLAHLQDALQTQLASSNATWRLLVGHHPVYSYGVNCFGQQGGLCSSMAFLLPWLAQYGVTAYFSGHDQDLQYLQMDGVPVNFVVSGAGSDVNDNEFDGLPPGQIPGAKFLSDNNGFVAVTVTSSQLTIYYYTTQVNGPSYTTRIFPAGSTG